MSKSEIRFILAEDLILIHCPDTLKSRHLVLELLIKTIKSDDLELAPRAEKITGKKTDIIDYILSL